jgi:hypothetical protein
MTNIIISVLKISGLTQSNIYSGNNEGVPKYMNIHKLGYSCKHSMIQNLTELIIGYRNI